MGSSASITAPGATGYRLSDDLARLCLPQEFRDSYRNLAWTNSVCALFLAVGLVGLKAPMVNVRTVVAPAEQPQLVVIQPEELPKPTELKPPEEVEQPQEVQTDVPQLTTVVLDTAKPAFARIVEAAGPVVVAQTAAAASAPPKNDFIPAPKEQAPEATKFTVNGSETAGGFYPDPEYPPIARKFKYQGTGRVDIVVDPAGSITSVKIMQSSGITMLDEAVVQTIRSRWRFPAGNLRHFWHQFTFKLL